MSWYSQIEEEGLGQLRILGGDTAASTMSRALCISWLSGTCHQLDHPRSLLAVVEISYMGHHIRTP